MENNMDSLFKFELNSQKNGYVISAISSEYIPLVITIPREYEFLPVTEIAPNGFSECSNLSVVLFEKDSQLKKIGQYAFYGCKHLESIEFPMSINFIDYGAFLECSSLQVCYLNSILPPRLSANAFYHTYNNLRIYVPKAACHLYKSGNYKYWVYYKSVIFEAPRVIPSSLGFFSFELNCDEESYSVKARNIELLPQNLVIPYEYNGLKVTQICNSGFYKSKIETLFISENIVYIGATSFQMCINLREVFISSSVESIGYFAFEVNSTMMSPNFTWSDSKLEKVTFEENSHLKYIGGSAFWGACKLKEFIIPESTKCLGTICFGHCGITKLYIPKNVEMIENEPCKQCTSLNEFIVDMDNKNFKAADGVLYSMDGTALISYPLGKKETIYNVPSNVTMFKGYISLWGCKYLRILRFNSIVPPKIFSKLTWEDHPRFKIYVPAVSYEEYINAPKFSNIKENIYTDDLIQGGLAITGDTLIECVEDEESMTIPRNINKIEKFALSGLLRLKNIYVEEGNEYFKSVDGVLFNKDMTELIAYPSGRNESEYEVPKNVKKLEQASFFQCNLEKLITHRQLEEIGDYAIYRCFKLSSIINVDNEDNIKVIGQYAFMECSSLTEINLNSIERIGASAFFLCYNLVSIVFESKIKEMLSTILYQRLINSKLKKVIFYASKPPAFKGLGDSSEIVSIYVLPESVEAYKNAPGFSRYADNIYPLSKNVFDSYGLGCG